MSLSVVILHRSHSNTKQSNNISSPLSIPSFAQCSANKTDNLIPLSPIELYSYAICPFCERAKAVLDFLGVPYRNIEVNPLTKSEIAFSADYKKVPIARILADEGGEREIINGSDQLIEVIRDRMFTQKQQRELVTKDTQVR